MIKLVLFDLDGVLIDAKKLHYDALNIALGNEYSISEKEHAVSFYQMKMLKIQNLILKCIGKQCQ